MTGRGNDFDAVIIGGGPGGAAAAISLAGAGCRVALLEQKRMPKWKAGESLPPAARPLLSRLDVWGDFLGDGHLPSYGNVSIWGGSEVRETDFIRDPNGNGWHLDRPKFDERLRQTAKSGGTVLFEEARVIAVQGNAGAWQLEFGDESERRIISARWLIDASGRSSFAARHGLAQKVIFDSLTAFIGHFAEKHPDAPRDSRTLIEAASNGWWYTSPIPGGKRIVVFHTDPNTVRSGWIRGEAGFLALLSETRGVVQKIGKATFLSESGISSMPANSTRLDRLAGDGWLAVGDAAMSFDPLASRGIFNALYSGIKAAEVVLGTGETVESYRLGLETIHRTYLGHLQAFYAMETRWNAAPFWRSRRGGTQ